MKEKPSKPIEAAEYAQALAEYDEDMKTAEDVAEKVAFVYLTPRRLFSLWWASFIYHLK